MMMKGPEDFIRKKNGSEEKIPSHKDTQIYFFTEVRMFITTFDN